jgi:hypothetical protein
MQSHELLPLLPFLAPETLARVQLPTRAELDAADGPGTFLLRGDELAVLKARIAAGDALLEDGLTKLRQLADAELEVPPSSVTEKASLLPGHAANDYVSHAIYYWPDAAKKNGKPYVRRDGEVNPEALDDSRFDSKRLERLANSLFVLSLAYYLPDEPAYGRHAAALLRTWFIDEDTRQTPHFEFAQIVTGSKSERPAGLIEARRYIYALDAAMLIDQCPDWSDTDRDGLRLWVSDFFQWFRTSAKGVRAASSDNNIALWCDVQAAIYALYLGETELAASIVRDNVEQRLRQQVEPNGAQLQELRRAHPYDYVAFNLLAMMGLARAGETVGFDAWWHETADGRSFARAMDWLLRLAGPQRMPQGLESAARLTVLEAENATLEDLKRTLETRGAALEAARTRALEAEALAKELAKALARKESPLQKQVDAALTQITEFRAQSKVLREAVEHANERTAAAEEAKKQERVRRLAAEERAGEAESAAEKQRSDAKTAKQRLEAALNELATAKASAAREREAARQRQVALDAMQRSTSWRVTAPLRWVGRLGRRAPAPPSAATAKRDDGGANEFNDGRGAGGLGVHAMSGRELVGLMGRVVVSRETRALFLNRLRERGVGNVLRYGAERSARIVRSRISGGEAVAAKPPRKPGAVFNSVKAPQTPVAKNISRLKRLLHDGFNDAASRDMDAIARDPKVAPTDRALAAAELAKWKSLSRDPASQTATLELLDIVDACGGPPDGESLALLRVEALSALGRRVEALAFVAEGAHGLCAFDHLAAHAAQLDEPERTARILEAFNTALASEGLSPIRMSGDVLSLDVLQGTAPPASRFGPLVSVIVPVFNGEAHIERCLRSLSAQTWAELEIIVSDDASTDRTAEVVEAYAAKDARVRLVRNPVNGGPYCARNAALAEAKGAFITTHDADDWSHPEKIAYQVDLFAAHPRMAANLTQQVRVTDDFSFQRRGRQSYVGANLSSLMFKRSVHEEVGFWDSVRFAADSEFLRRLRAKYGKDNVPEVMSPPLSIMHLGDGNITSTSGSEYNGYKAGARKAYEDKADAWHKSKASFYMPARPAARPFPIPRMMAPAREKGIVHYDVVLASDFRLPGGTNMSNAEEIKAQKRLGLRTGLLQLSRYDVSPYRDANPVISDLVDGKDVDWLFRGESIECDLLVIRLPWVLQEWQESVPNVKAKAIRVIVNQPPKRDYGPDSPFIYQLPRCASHLKRYFGDIGVWHPIGPLVREALLKHHAGDLQHINLSDDNWPNIIDVDEWRRPLRPARGERVRIGRHSRDQYVKWPATRDALLEVYPGDPGYEVRILGGADTPKALLDGRLPKTWQVIEFGKAEPRDFLAGCDVFVYFTHPDWVESFGRVMFEAMAVGVPVILPEMYRPLFGEAAIYAHPSEVRSTIDALMSDDAAYEAQVRRASAFVERRFGHGEHAARLSAIMGRRFDSAAGGVLDRDDAALRGSAADLVNFDDAVLTREAETYVNARS